MSGLNDSPPVAGDGESDGPGVAAPDVPVTAHESTAERTVFIEDGNTDGWIASSLTVDVQE